MKENRLQAKILKFLRSLKIYVVKIIVCNDTGVADLLCCVKGKFVAIEVKAPGKIANTSEKQKHHQKMVIDAGGISFVADSLEKVEEEIKKLMNT